MKKTEYYLGLDVGTNSIGWAVTDKEYNLLRAKGKDLWGVYSFKEGNTAADRRGYRSSRRRTERKRGRLQLLQEIFSEEIEKVDKDFYLRLEESKYWYEDKRIDTKYALFDDPHFTDNEYYNEYPTIFHLRDALIKGEKNSDIRLYFLAINQMMKRRGHFLFQGQKFDVVPDVSEYIDFLSEHLSDNSVHVLFSKEFIYEILEIIESDNMGKTDKKNAVKAKIQVFKLQKEETIKIQSTFDLLISGKMRLDKLFGNPEYKNLETKEVSFEGDSYEANRDAIAEEIGDDFSLVETLKKIYDYLALKKILKDSSSISEAQVSKYNKHKKDLKKLKKLIRRYSKGKHKNSYDDFFNRELKDPAKNGNYAHYIGRIKVNGKKVSLKKCNETVFNKDMKKLLESICDHNDSLYLEIKNEIELDTFLPKQISNNNSVIPYQLHHNELVAILDNLVKDYPSFMEKEGEVTKAEKIDLLFRFKIPYYVGPLNPAHKGMPGVNSWIVKNKDFENESIRPWNFERVVDLTACEEEFINRLINQCTYLPDQEVLPKESLLYSEYMVLQELNNLKVDGVEPPIDIKKKIYTDLFCKYKNVSQKQVKKWLVSNNYADKDLVLSGFDKEFKSSLKSHIELERILGKGYDRKLGEDIIKWLTIHSSNAKVAVDRIAKEYPHLSEDALAKISNLKYKDWGKFSRKFLEGLKGVDLETGETGNIIHFLREKNDNLMQLLSDRYTFNDRVLEYKSKFTKDDISYEMLDDLYVSPSVRKMIWNVLSLTEEVRSIIGHGPKRIFLEMARGKEDKPKETNTRKSQLTALYENIKDESRQWIKELEGRGDHEFRSKRLYLYYTQMGRCMYSGKPIDLSQLNNSNLYDIDHIIPKSLKKDDSLHNNLVLVEKTLNEKIKSNKYPVPGQFRNTQSAMWRMLLDKGLITKEKYERLIRYTPLTNEELAGFIQRQIVETRQSTKAVADTFKQVYKDTKTVYVQAGLISEFRQKFDMLKSRDINDLHHAHDAYLNIIVGNGYYTKFTGNALEFVKSNRGNYTLNKLFEYDIKGPGGNYAWKANHSIKHVKNILNKTSILYTKEPYEAKGELFNATLMGKRDIKKGTRYLPHKNEPRLKNVNKYGGYVTIKGSYFFIVEHTAKKGKRIKTIEFVPVYLREKIGEEKWKLIEYCKNDLGLTDPVIIVNKILMGAMAQIDGFRYFINGRSKDTILLQPAYQPFWNQKDSAKFKLIIGAFNKSTVNNKKLKESERVDFCKDLDRKMLVEMLEKVQEKLRSKPYSSRQNVPSEAISSINNIDELSNWDLAFTIGELLKLVTATTGTSDLSKIGGGKFTGKPTINKNISLREEFVLIYQSKTCVYQRFTRII